MTQRTNTNPASIMGTTQSAGGVPGCSCERFLRGKSEVNTCEIHRKEDRADRGTARIEVCGDCDFYTVAPQLFDRSGSNPVQEVKGAGEQDSHYPCPA